MNEHKFTPGPWEVKFRGLDAFVKCPDERSFNIGDILYHEDNKANAQLIAAAPDLLDACEVVRDFFLRLENDSAFRRRIHGPLLGKLNTAIAKALGE
jgi:hypothetical protein